MNTAKSIIPFTNKIIDYAGLFPPAKLELPEALNNYFKYREGEHKFMLSRFICPVRLFPELDILLNRDHSDKGSIEVSAIGSGGINIEEFMNNLDKDLAKWKEIISRSGDRVKINSLETKLPDGLKGAGEVSDLIDSVTSKIRSDISEPVFIFFEGNQKDKFKEIINGISDHDLKDFDSGFKLRTGGVTADAFPDSETIAHCIRECLDRKVPMKFTAGLHHPFRHLDKKIGTKMHGFINVFGAGIIANRHDLSNKGIEEILNDEDPANFIFTDEYFSWKDWKIEIADIEFARNDLVLSFGSCSFDEPVDDLTSLNLL